MGVLRRGLGCGVVMLVSVIAKMARTYARVFVCRGVSGERGVCCGERVRSIVRMGWVLIFAAWTAYRRDLCNWMR